MVGTSHPPEYIDENLEVEGSAEAKMLSLLGETIEVNGDTAFFKNHIFNKRIIFHFLVMKCLADAISIEDRSFRYISDTLGLDMDYPMGDLFEKYFKEELQGE